MMKKTKTKLPKKASDIDYFENNIRANPDHYNSVVFIPLEGLQTTEHKDLSTAQSYALKKIKEDTFIRTVMIYAVDKDGRFAMVGSFDHKGNYKKVIERK